MEGKKTLCPLQYHVKIQKCILKNEHGTYYLEENIARKIFFKILYHQDINTDTHSLVLKCKNS